MVDTWIIVLGVAVAAAVVGVLVLRQRDRQDEATGTRRPTTARERRLLEAQRAPSAEDERPRVRERTEDDDYEDAASYDRAVPAYEPEPAYDEPVVAEEPVDEEPVYEEPADTEPAYEDPVSAYSDLPEVDVEAASLAELEREVVAAESEPPPYSSVDEEDARFANRRVRDIGPAGAEPAPVEPEPEDDEDAEPEPLSASGLAKRTPKAADGPVRPHRISAASSRPVPAARRSPEQIRRTLSSYRGGLKAGREAEGTDEG
jgi:hypothetical protein